MENNTDITVTDNIENEVPKPSGLNPIYQFLKSNNLTDKDEKTFLNEYSNPQKANELHSFLKANDLTDKDSASFYDTYLKKKDGGTNLVSNQKANPSQYISVPTAVQLSSPDFNQGEKMAQVGYTMPAPAKKEGEQAKVRVSPKLFGFPGEVDVSTDKDVIVTPNIFGPAGSVNVTTKGDQEEPSYFNIAQNFSNNLLKGGAEIGSSLGEIFRDIGAKQARGIAKLTGSEGAKEFANKKSQALYTSEGKPTEYAQGVTWASDPEAKTILGLNGIKENAQELQEKYTQLPNTALGSTLQGISNMAPDILASEFMPGMKAAEGASWLMKAGQKLVTPFTTYMLTKEPIVAYGNVKKQGGTPSQALSEVPMAALGGAIQGATVAGVGELTGLATKEIMQGATKYLLGPGSKIASNEILAKAAKSGLTGTGGLATKELLHTVLDAAGYGLAYPMASGAIAGKMPSKEDYINAIGTSLLFSAKRAYEGAKTFNELNKAVDQIQAAKQASAFINFMQATPESIAKVHGSKESADELQLQALEAAKKAKSTVDTEEKHKAVIQASTLQKAANVKQMADLVISDKSGFNDFLNSDIPQNIKDAFIEKADQINKISNPTEIKKTELGNKMTQGQNFIDETNKAIATETDSVKKTEMEFQVEQAQKNLDKNKTDLKNLISGQQTPRNEDLNNNDNVKENQKIHNKEIDDKLASLNPDDPDYAEKKESLLKEKEEVNSHYENLIQKNDNLDKNNLTQEEFNKIHNANIDQTQIKNLNDKRQEQYDVLINAAKQDPNFKFTESFDDFNKKIDGEGGEVYLRDLYKRAEPFVPKDVIGEEKGHNEDSFVNYLTNPKVGEVKPLSGIKEFTLGYAPFREGKITDISEGEKAFKNKAFESWKKMANQFAQNIGLEVVSDNNTIGKYGATSTIGEASSVPTVRGTKEQVDLFGALMGTLAPEGQHSVMTLEYDPNGKTEEHRIKFDNKESAIDFVKNASKYGIEDLSLFPESNSVMILDNGNVDHKKLIDDYGKQITDHKRLKVNQEFIGQDRYAGILQEHGDTIGGRYSPEYRENISDAIKLAKERAGRLGSDYGEKSEQAKIDAKKATQNYIDKNKEELGLPDNQPTSVKKIDPELAKRIKDAYDALPMDDSKNPEVKAAYEKAASEIDKQFQYLTKELGIKVEFIKDDPYKNSDEMFEDIIKNKRLKVFQGGEPHPFLGESTRDANGFTANEKLRAIHDYFGHFVNRNQFGKIGEEAAWVDHSKMFSPEAQRAISTETRGQNSWVNSSGVNDEAIQKMKDGNQLIKEGKIKEGQEQFKFAEQKVALMPKELTDWTKYVDENAPKAKLTVEEEPVKEQPQEQPSEEKKQEGIKISKAALKNQYNFSAEFDRRGGEEVAVNVLTELNKRAKENGINLNQQIYNEIEKINQNPQPTEFNIIIAGKNLLDIDGKIKDAIAKNDKTIDIEELKAQRDEASLLLRKLSNAAGRNLGLFNLVFHDANESNINVTRDEIKKKLNISDVPETMDALKKSNLTAYEKEKAAPYVKELENIKEDYKKEEEAINKRMQSETDKKLSDAIKTAYEEGFAKGKEDKSSEAKTKRSKSLKDLASKLRASDEMDKFLKGAGPLGGAQKASFVDLGSYKEIIANVLEGVAKVVEAGENVEDYLKKTIDKLKNVDQKKVLDDIRTLMSKAVLRPIPELDKKISELASNENATNITKSMVDAGLISDYVKHSISPNATNDKVIEDVTNKLKKLLPNVTKNDVTDAFIKVNKFKEETKSKLENIVKEKIADVKRLALKEARLSALESANDYHEADTKEKKKAIKSEYEKGVDEKIKNLTSQKNKEEETAKSTPLEKAKKSVEDRIEAIRKEISDKERQKKEQKEKFHADDELNRLKEVEKSLSELRDKYLPKDKEKFSDEKSLKERRKNILNEISNLNDQINSKTREAKKVSVEDTEEIKKLKEIKKQKSDLLDVVAPDIEKINKEKQKHQDRIDAINKEIEYVRSSKKVYEQAIKNSKSASEDLIKARSEREKSYTEAGLKLEKNDKNPILIEREYQKALEDIDNNKNMSKDDKKAKKDELKQQRDLDINGTKQGVVSSVLDDVNNFIDENIKKSNDAILNEDKKTIDYHNDLNIKLNDIVSKLNPTGEKLDNQIDKAYDALEKLSKDENIKKEDIDLINEIKNNLENNNQLTSNEISAKRLKRQWENEIKSAKGTIESGNFTKIPTDVYDFRNDVELNNLKRLRDNTTGRLSRLVEKAREENKSKIEKAIDLSTKFLVSGIHTAAKVGEAAIFKPFMDAMVERTTGKLISKLTNTPSVNNKSIIEGFKTLGRYKNKAAADADIARLQKVKEVAIKNLEKAHELGDEKEINKAEKAFQKADLDYGISTLYNSIDANSVASFLQYLKHGATDYDVSIGKGIKRDISEYRTKLAKTGYILDGWIRMHSAMKSSLSARPEMMMAFSSTLQDFQKKGMPLNEENISTAMVIAANAFEEGRLTNKTGLSKILSRAKGSEKTHPVVRGGAKILFPVSTIAINLAKRGIDYSSVGAEGWARLYMETKKGMKLNEMEGKEFDSFAEKIKEGINRIPLQERKYINGVISRGLFGTALGLIAWWGLGNGQIKYGGTFDDQRKRKIMGSDGQQLKAGEWEFFGERAPKAASLFLNHLPEFLPLAMTANAYQINEAGGGSKQQWETGMQEIEARLPFQTLAGLLIPGKASQTLIDRARIPLAAEISTATDVKGEERDKSDLLNRAKGNIGLGFLNPTKDQQKQINKLDKEYPRISKEERAQFIKEKILQNP